MTCQTEHLNALVELVYAAATAEGEPWATVLGALAQAMHAERACVDATPDMRFALDLVPPPTGSVTSHVEGNKRAGTTFRATLVAEGIATTLVVVRGPGSPRFTDQDITLGRSLLPHIVRARALHQRIRNLEGQNHAASDVLDRLPLGILLLTSDARVLHANTIAKGIFAKRDGLGITNHRLTATRPATTTELRRLIADTRTGGVLPVVRPSCARPFSVVITPLDERPRLATATTPVAIAFISDPEWQVRPLEGMLTPLYGLTPTESLVAALLVQGARVESIARQLKVTLNTVRTHLKRIYSKTGVQCQSSLVRMLLVGPTLLRFDIPRSGPKAA